MVGGGCRVLFGFGVVVLADLLFLGSFLGLLVVCLVLVACLVWAIDLCVLGVVIGLLV